MAAGGDGEHTRFPFLATVRYMVATVVTVLTVVVVVMVSTVAHRPEEIRLSIDRGYILADRLWSVNETEVVIPRNLYARAITPQRIGARGQPYRPCQGHVYTYHRDGGCANYQGRGSVGMVTQLVKTYRAADSVNLWIYLSAHNPSGRASVRCTVTTIRVLDMPNAPPLTFTGMVEIARFDFNETNSVFSVPRQTSHSLRKSVVIDDENALLYIFEQYVGESSFIAIVEVNATVFYGPLLSTKKHVSQLCWPVTVGYDTLATAAVSCKTREEIDWIVNSQLPAPAPAPAPADGN